MNDQYIIKVQDNVCYICMESTPPLARSPCDCKGTCGLVHTECLDKWRATFAASDARFSTCMQCGAMYETLVDADLENSMPSQSHPCGQYVKNCLLQMIKLLLVTYFLLFATSFLHERFQICVADAHCQVVWLGIFNLIAAIFTPASQRRNTLICNAPFVLMFPDHIILAGCIITSLLFTLTPTNNESQWEEIESL